MPSPRLLKLLAEGLSEAPSGLRRASQELPTALLEGLKKTPELAEALLQVLGKLKAKSPGIADALQEAAASFLAGKKTPEMIQKAREARSIATGEHMMGTGRKQTGMPQAEAVKPGVDPSEMGPFVPTHRPPVSPEEIASPRSLRRQGEVESKVGRFHTQMSQKEIRAFYKKAFSDDPKTRAIFGPSTASEEANILRPARQRLGIQEPQKPSQAAKAEVEVVPPGKQLWKSPKGSGKGSRLSPQEVQVRASAEEMAGPWGKITEQLSLPMEKPYPPTQRWLSEPPRGYAQFLPQKGTMTEVRPGPLRPQAGPGVVPQKSYDPTLPEPKVEVSPEDLFVSPEVQQLYRRIILGKE